MKSKMDSLSLILFDFDSIFIKLSSIRSNEFPYSEIMLLRTVASDSDSLEILKVRLFRLLSSLRIFLFKLNVLKLKFKE